jgi:hypothetical protein
VPLLSLGILYITSGGLGKWLLHQRLTVRRLGSGAAWCTGGDGGRSTIGSSSGSARAGKRRFWPLSALRAHTKAPHKTDLHRKTLMALNRPGAARTVPARKRADQLLHALILGGELLKPEIHRVDP